MKAVRARSQQVITRGSPRTHVVLLDNRIAIEAARAKRHVQLGFACATCTTSANNQSGRLRPLLLVSMQKPRQPFCAISGGEFSCPVRGDGRGGRNLETALRCAIQSRRVTNNGQHLVVLSAGTDGIDGNSPAAGAIADETTISQRPGARTSMPNNISPAATRTASSNS